MAEGEGRLLGGRYRLQSVLGRGGMGIVWRAVDEVLGRDVAVKEVLVPRGLEDDAREVLHKRMLREARAAARLSHPGIVTVHDVVEEDGSPWIVMEFVEAKTLQDIVDDDGPLPPGQVAEIGRQLLGALRTAHVAGILHRDVKPANVMLSKDRAVLTDFGIAHMEGDVSLTQTGIVMGSPAYISPERAQGDRPGPPSDLWALGATLYMAVEGHPPHDREDVLSTLAAVMMEDVPEPKLAGPLSPLLLGLLIKDPATRLDAAGAAELLQRTDSYAGAPVHAEMTAVDSPVVALATEALPTNVIPAGPVGPAFDSLYAPTPRWQPAPAPRPTPVTFPAPQRPSRDEAWRNLDGGGTQPRLPSRKRGLGTSAVVGAIIGTMIVIVAAAIVKFGLPNFSTSGDPSPSTSSTAQSPLTLVGVDDGNLHLKVPVGWTKQTVGKSVYWNDPKSRAYVQLDRIPWTGTALQAFVDWEQAKPLSGYERVDLKSTAVGKLDAAVLEMRFDGQATRMHAKDMRVRTAAGLALLVAFPDDNWAAIEKTADNILKSLRTS